MKKLLTLLFILLLVKPVLGFSYADELINGNETYSSIANVSYEGRGYFLYGIYLDKQPKLIVLQDSLNNLVEDNKTIQNVFYDYRLKLIETSENATIENPKYMADKDFISFIIRIQEKENIVSNKTNIIENFVPQFQSSVLNLSSQGAQVLKSITLLSDFQDLIWQSKLLMVQNRFNSAYKILEDAEKLIPKINLDITYSFKVNQGNKAMDSVLTLILDAKRQGLDVKDIENEFDNANSLLFVAKEDYQNENYDVIDSKINSILYATDKIIQDISEILITAPKIQQNVSSNPLPQPSPTSLAIRDYSWISLVLGIAVISIAIFIIYKRRTSRFVYHYKK
jgi:hypothetical protein